MIIYNCSTTLHCSQLITILEDRGVPPEAFVRLQEMSVAEARTTYSSLIQSSKLMRSYKLGDAYGISRTFQGLKSLGLDFSCSDDTTKVVKSSFLRSIVHCSVNTILQDVKYGARIRVPESWKLVGVADEGPAYEAQGVKDVYRLQEVFGGNAVSDEYGIGRHVANLFVTQTYEGQSDIHGESRTMRKLP